MIVVILLTTGAVNFQKRHCYGPQDSNATYLQEVNFVISDRPFDVTWTSELHFDLKIEPRFVIQRKFEQHAEVFVVMCHTLSNNLVINLQS